MEIKEHYSNMFLGCSYKLKTPDSIGQLKRDLQTIIEDLPEDDNLKIDCFSLKDNEIFYLLKEGIIDDP